MKLKKSYLLMLCLFITGLIYAQTGTIKGFVYQKETGEPVMFTTIYLKGTTIGQSTDVNGYFSITQIPPGSYTITITSMGFDTLQEAVTVKAGDIIQKKLYVVQTNVKLETVEVSAQQVAKQGETSVSVNKIDPVAIKKLPTVGGEPDIA